MNLAFFQELETELLRIATRRDPVRLRALLSEDFVEFGASGRVYTRTAVIDLLQSEAAAALEMTGFAAEALAEDVVLVTYRAVRHQPGAHPVESLRCSLWVRQGERWRMRFHQGTRTEAQTG